MTAPHYDSRPGSAGSPERSIGELLADLSKDTGTLLRQEVKLAGAELKSKVAVAGRQFGFVAAAAVLGLLGLLLLLQSLIIGLSAYMPLWVSALVVGLGVLALAAALASKGIAGLRAADLMPRETLQSLEANKSLIQGQAE